MNKKVLGAMISFVVLFALPAYVYVLTDNGFEIGYNQGYEPDQPIPYSHKLHAGEMKIDCKYCHNTTEVSRHASVPSLNICMNCHMNIAKDSPALTKLKEAFMNETPVAWNKVHLLPDHVKFSHEKHVNAGKACTDCHGPVEQMDTVYQWSSLSMGFCVNCHRKPENNATINCGTCHY